GRRRHSLGPAPGGGPEGAALVRPRTREGRGHVNFPGLKSGAFKEKAAVDLAPGCPALQRGLDVSQGGLTAPFPSTSLSPAFHGSSRHGAAWLSPGVRPGCPPWERWGRVSSPMRSALLPTLKGRGFRAGRFL